MIKGEWYQKIKNKKENQLNAGGEITLQGGVWRDGVTRRREARKSETNGGKNAIGHFKSYLEWPAEMHRQWGGRVQRRQPGPISFIGGGGGPKIAGQYGLGKL